MSDNEIARKNIAKRAIIAYENEASELWNKIGKSGFRISYAKRGGVMKERWSEVTPLWGNRYGGGTSYTDEDGDGEIEVTGKGDGARAA